MKNTLHLFTLIAVLFFNSCIDGLFEPPCNRYYTFEYPISIYPVNDTINIGDTLWVEIDIDNLIEDKETSEMIDISDLDLHFMMLNYRYELDYPNNSLSDFDILIMDGNHQLSSTRSFLAFDDKAEKKFKLALIPKVSGGQAIAIAIPPDIDDEPYVELSSEECLVFFSDSTKVIVNETGQRNIYQLEGLYLVSGTGDTLYYGTGSELERHTDAYVFYVR